MRTHSTVVLQREKDGPLEFVEVALPEPGPHQVIVKVIATGLCQSQVYWMHAERTQPVLFGHEGYGIVAATGSQVRGIREGDPVLVTWLPRRDPEGRAPQTAEIRISRDVVARSPNVYTWADHCIADELNVKPIGHRRHSDVMSVLGCAVVTGAGAVLNAARARAGETVAVFGVGGIGLCAVAAARAAGASRIVAVDRDPAKLEFAKRFGATDGIDATSAEAPSTAIHRVLSSRCGCGSGADVVIDCVGQIDTIQQAYRSLRDGRWGIERGGRCVIVGLPKAPATLDVLDMVMKEKSVLGTAGGSCVQEQIEEFIDWHESGALDLSALVTRRYRFHEIPQGAAALERGEISGRAIAVV